MGGIVGNGWDDHFHQPKNVKKRVAKVLEKLEHGNKRHRKWLRTKGLKLIMPLIYRLLSEKY